MEIEAESAEVMRDDLGAVLVAHRDGDEKAFAKLVQHYRRPVYGYLVHCGVSEGDRDDLFQDVFVKIHRQAHRYEPSRPLHPWLFTIVANTVRSYLRKQKIRRIFVSEPPSTDAPDPAPDSEAIASSKETARWLAREMPKLPEPQRAVLVLASVERLSLKDIAAALGIPINTVKTRLRRARLHLAERFERRQASAS